MNTSPSTTRNHRARWAAVGAAIAVSLGAGGIGLVNATSPDGASTLVPIDPCRIADTRPTQQIGLKSDAFGPRETHTVQTQSGNTGQCDPLPAGITALALNVTAVGASELTHLTFWASGPVPNSSNLNPAPGQPPTPNAVTVDVAGDGSFRVFNFAGNVHLIIDVLGYYTDHDHDDRYYTQAQSDARFAPAEDDLVVMLQGQDFVPTYLGQWDLLTSGILRHTGAKTCTQARLDLPPGATVEQIDVVFRSVAGAVIDVRVLSRTADANNAVASDNTRLHFANELPSGVSNEYSLLEIEHDPAHAATLAGNHPFAASPTVGWAQHLDLCVEGTAAFTNLKVHLAGS